MRGAISLGIGAIIAIVLAVIAVFLIVVFFQNGLFPIPNLIWDATPNVSLG